MRWLLLGLILAAFGAGFVKASLRPAGAAFAVPAKPDAGGGAAFFRSDFASSAQRIQTHAASLVELRDGRVRAFWFAGSREGAKDVEIRSAVFDPVQERWSAEQAIVTRERTAAALQRYISKLGNPVAGRAADGKLWLYYVTVSVGGWAGSSITAMSSDDDGANWSAPRRLVTSPFLNLSTLVKGAPFHYADGTLGLPVYHEFIAKFAELLRFDRQGSLIDEQRLSAGRDHGLQPVLLAKSPTDSLVLMRYAGADAPHRVLSASTRDGGQHWTAPVKTLLSNPDAALAAVMLEDGRIVAVLNDQEQGRNTLSLMVSADGGGTWKNVYQLEDQRDRSADDAAYLKTVEALAGITDAQAALSPGNYVESARLQECVNHNCGFEFSYPYLIRTRRGDFHLAYTWNRSFIKHITFNQGWLDQQSKQAK
jgi:predicted neuraminidase